MPLRTFGVSAGLMDRYGCAWRSEIRIANPLWGVISIAGSNPYLSATALSYGDKNDRFGSALRRFVLLWDQVLQSLESSCGAVVT